MSTERDALIMAHKQAVIELEAVKAKEMALRKKLAETYFPNAKEGVNNLELGNGYKLKFTRKLNYRLAGKDDVDAALDDIEKLGNEGSFIGERLVRWKPDLSVSEYKRLLKSGEGIDNSIKHIIGRVLTISDAAPTIELVEPKNKG